MSSINAIATTAHQADLRRVAERRRPRVRGLPPSRATDPLQATVTVRLAHSDEAQLVRDLAALDDAPAPEGPVLLALMDGEAVAALSLRDQRVVANRFVLTQDAVAILRLRAQQPSGTRPRRWWQAVLSPRFA